MAYGSFIPYACNNQKRGDYALKKKVLFLLALLVCFCGMCNACAEVIMLPDFEITKDGEIKAYYGDEWVVVPDEIDGIPVIKIGEKAFFDLGIKDAYLPEGLSVIGNSSFEGCNITSVDIPSTVKIIGESAFENCWDLLTVFINFDENTLIGENAFKGTGELVFYINCDVDTKAIERKLLASKGDSNFEVNVRHVAAEYDEKGNVKCNGCGFYEQEELPFEDVLTDVWYYDYVVSAYQNNIIEGKSERIFDPDSGMTSAEAVKIAATIHMLFNDTKLDTPEGPWYQQYVDYCYKYNLIDHSVVFDWEAPVTRAEMAYIFANCDPWDEWYEDINDVPLTDISDVSTSTPFAYQILTLYNKGIAVGDENMSFHPDEGIRRCEAAAIISRIMDWHKRIELPKG